VKNLLLFGGSFNPPHIGHMFALCYAMSTGKFKEADVIPVYKHAYDKELIDFNHRMEMCSLAFEWLRKVYVGNAEEALTKKRGGQIYTYDLVMQFRNMGVTKDIYLLLGTDAYQDMSNWHESEKLLKEITPFVVPRNLMAEGVSSSTIRKDVSKNRFMLPPTVWDYIQKHKLYDL